jgi:hypothetical protein
MSAESRITQSVPVIITGDYLLNWRQVKSGFFPEPHHLLLFSAVEMEADLSIFIEAKIGKQADPHTNPLEIRDWLKQEVRHGYSMFGRYEVTRWRYRTEREFRGLRFQFKDPRDAIYFSLRWRNGR